jgi:hypothetical protein
MKGSRFTIMKKLIIAIGIVAAILAILISFKAKGGIEIIGRSLNLNTLISIAIDDRNQI